MMNKVALAICLFVVAAAGSALATGSVAAQTATPTSAMMESTMTPSPTTSVPGGAPETGRK